MGFMNNTKKYNRFMNISKNKLIFFLIQSKMHTQLAFVFWADSITLFMNQPIPEKHINNILYFKKYFITVFLTINFFSKINKPYPNS